jgi:chromosome segregation ATPase
MGVIKTLEGTLRETQQSLTDTENKLKEEHEAAVQQTADADAVTQEALANMVLLEDELTQRKAENNSLRMELMSTQDGLIALKDLKESAISQLVTRCETFERDLSLVTGEQNATLQEQSLLRKSMQESYVQAQREKHELTDQLKLMQDRIKRLRLEAEENERNLEIELQERADENKLLITSLETQKNMNSTLDEGNRRVQDSLRLQLTRLRSDLDSSRFLDSSSLKDTAHPESPDKIAAKQKSELVRARQVELTINFARHLPKVDLMGTCDAYCEIEWQGEKHKTTVKKNSYSPDWNETFAFSFDDISADVSDLSVVVIDWDMIKKADVVGKVVIPADNLQAFLQQKQNVTQEVSYPVLNKGTTVTGNDKQPCVINLKMCLLVPNEESLPTVSAPLHVDGRGHRNKEHMIATSPHDRSIVSKSLEGGKQDEEEQLLDAFESEIERIKTAILTAETLNAQLIAKVANLDGTLLEQTALNQTLRQEVTRAHENTGKIRELEERSKIIEGENANYKDTMAQLKHKLENIERKTQEELNKYKDAISSFHHALENGISEQAALRKSFEEELLRINKIKDDAEQRSKILESVNARHEDTIKKFEDDMARVIKIKADEVEHARQKVRNHIELNILINDFKNVSKFLQAITIALTSETSAGA